MLIINQNKIIIKAVRYCINLNNMKNNIKKTIFFVAFVALLSSCTNDEDPVVVGNKKPTISNFEYGSGHGDTYKEGIGYIGRDIHIEGKINAPNKIQSIIVEIHKEGHDHGAKGDKEWEFRKKYDEFNGQINPTFHKHVDIPETAEAGEYHFHFKVTDLAGLIVEIKKDIQIKKVAVDPTAPSIVGEFEMGTGHGKDFKPGIAYLGRDIHIEGKMKAPNKIKSVVVEIHKEGDHHHAKATKEWTFKKEYDQFKGKGNEAEGDLPVFHKHVDIPKDAEQGEYHFHFKITDNKGLTLEIERELEIKSPPAI